MMERRRLLEVLAMAQGLRYATGQFTIEKQYTGVYQVTHNLGTKKVFALWWLENETEYNNWNRAVIANLLNWHDVIPETYHVNFINGSQYWDHTTQAGQNGFTASQTALSYVNRAYNYSDLTVTENTFSLYFNYYNIWIPGTYHWIIIALDEALNEAGGL